MTMNNSNSAIAERLGAYRRELELTQVEMADRMGVTQSHYSKLESGHTNITYQNLECFRKSGGDVYFLITGQTRVDGKVDGYFARCGSDYQRRKMFPLFLWLTELGADLTGSVLRVSDQTKKSAKLMQSYSEHLTIWENIRKAESFSQMRMAEIFDINIKRYRKIEKGESRPDAEILQALYEKLSYSPLVIMDRDLCFIDEMNQIWEQFPDELLQSFDRLICSILHMINDYEEPCHE